MGHASVSRLAKRKSAEEIKKEWPQGKKKERKEKSDQKDRQRTSTVWWPENQVKTVCQRQINLLYPISKASELRMRINHWIEQHEGNW